MIGRVDEVVIDCAEPGPLARFWADVLGGAPHARDDAWHTVRAPGSPLLAFQRVPERKTGKNRLHLDVLVDDVEQAAAAAVALGASRVGAVHRDAAGSFQVLLDPEGNEWCVVRPPS